MWHFEVSPPMLPASYDIVWMAVAGVALLLAVVGLVLLVRDRHTSPLMTVVWLVAMIAIPVIAPLLYVLTRREREVRAATESEAAHGSR